jgi:hypothetical protein
MMQLFGECLPFTSHVEGQKDMATYQNKIPPILPPKRAVQILQNCHVQNLDSSRKDARATLAQQAAHHLGILL